MARREDTTIRDSLTSLLQAEDALSHRADAEPEPVRDRMSHLRGPLDPSRLAPVANLASRT